MGHLVLELQRDALDSQVPVSTLLLKALAVSRKLDLKDMDAWIEREIRGYPEGAEVPPYRRIIGELRVQNAIRGLIPIVHDSEEGDNMPGLVEHSVVNSVAELEGLSEHAGRLIKPMGAIPNGPRLAPLCLVLQRASLRGVIEGVRHILVEWTLQLEKGGVLGEGLSFSAEERRAAQAVPQNVMFIASPVSNAIIQQGQSENSATLSIEVAALDALIAKASAWAAQDPEARAPITTELAAVREEARSPQPQRGRIATRLKTIAEFLKTAKAGTDLIQAVGKIVDLFT